MVLLRSIAALAAASPAMAQQAGSYQQVGSTLVSAMMMFLGNDEKVYIMDKVEGNAEKINGHPAWASVWDIASKHATTMDFMSNSFCASGAHFPNGTFMTFGGNSAVDVGGDTGKVIGNNATYDATYDDWDGRKSVRVLKPCTGDPSKWGQDCQWFDDASVMSMQAERWYSTAESLGDGSVVLIGGMTGGGYINRNYPNTDCNEGGGAENSFEFWPSRGPKVFSPFLCKTSGLNTYPHAFLMPSGKMFLQANYSTTLLDVDSNTETALPDMPNQIVRVYPASGAVAMLPLTPANNYTPTILFCGGIYMSDEQWGDYSYPAANTWTIPSSNDCQRITPEPTDGSSPQYVQDDDMIDTRTMGQFITLPTGKLLVLNGARNGTAGYSDKTHVSDTNPFGRSLASDPNLTPAIYDPAAPAGKRWSNSGLGSSSIPRLYHSTALLLPDGSVLVAGSNPNVDVNLTTVYNTTYEAEIFYPPYFSASTRPVPTGVPANITYGGAAFDITVPASGYSGAANDAAANTQVVLIRPGWTTHAMNMGQRMLVLNSTYTVKDDGSLVLHTAQAPPNANLFTPGPALVFVVVNGIPSNGTFVTVGSGVLGTQPTADVAVLPPSATGAASASGGASSATPSATASADSSSKSHESAAGRALPSLLAVAAVAALAAAFV